MRKFALILAILFLAAVTAQLTSLNARRMNAAEKLSGIAAELGAVEEENKKLQADLSYYADPANLEKELRARFNYKSPGEELIIVVPRR